MSIRVPSLSLRSPFGNQLSSCVARMTASFVSSSAAMATASFSGCWYRSGSYGGHQRIASGQRTSSASTSRIELPTRRAPAEYPGRYTSEATDGAERRPTFTTVIFVVDQPQKHPVEGHPAAMPWGPAPPPGGTVQMLENTTTWSLSRNMVVGQPSISSLPATARSCGGQLVAVNRFRPESTKMRVPSFLTKSASSTPATWVFVVL